MSLYACFSFSQVVANTWQCIIHLKAIRYIQSWKQEKNSFEKWIILPRSPLLKIPKTSEDQDEMPQNDARLQRSSLFAKMHYMQ